MYVEETDQKLWSTQFIYNKWLSSGYMYSQFSVNSTTLQANNHTKINRQPFRFWKMEPSMTYMNENKAEIDWHKGNNERGTNLN